MVEECAHDWTLVSKKAYKPRQWNTDLEYSVELLLSYQDGLQTLVSVYGIDSLSESTYNDYVEAHLLGGEDISKNLPRNCGEVPTDHQKTLPRRGFINIKKGFVHVSLVFVNPPHDFDHHEATSFIQNELSKRWEQLANMELPEIVFSPEVHCGQARGQRKVWRIDSSLDASGSLLQRQWIAALREKVRRMFEDNGFCVRSPQEPPDQLHITARDERYETRVSSLSSKVTPSLPSKGNLPLALHLKCDKFAVMPAAENDPRHNSRRQYCGSTHTVNIFPRRPQLLHVEPVIEEVRHKGEAAASVDLEGDADIDMLLRSTARGNRSVASMGGGSSSVRDESKFADQKHDNAFLNESVWKLRLSSSRCPPSLLKEALGKSPELQACQFALDETMMFVRPEQYETVLALLQGESLRPFHVIITESLVNIFEQAFKTLDYRVRPKIKQNARKAILDTGSSGLEEHVADRCQGHEMRSEQIEGEQPCFASDGILKELCTKHTFLGLVRVLHNARSVIQSTTEAVNEDSRSHYGGFRGTNPRRFPQLKKFAPTVA